MPSLHEASVKHARYYLEVANQSNELYTSDKANEQAGLKLFDSERGQIDKAWTWLQRQPSSSDIDVLLVLFAEATSAVGMLRYNIGYEHIPHFRIQLEAAQRLNWHEAEAEALNNLGICFAFLGYHRQAINCFERALRIAREIGDQDLESDVQEYLRMARDQLSTRTEAGHQPLATTVSESDQEQITQLNRALRGTRLSNNQLVESEALENLGLFFSSIGDYGAAISFYEQAQHLHGSLDNRFAQCRCWVEIAFAFASLGNAKQSLELLDSASSYLLEVGFANADKMAGIVDVLQELLPVVESLDHLFAIQHPDAERFAKKLEPVFHQLSRLMRDATA